METRSVDPHTVEDQITLDIISYDNIDPAQVYASVRAQSGLAAQLDFFEQSMGRLAVRQRAKMERLNKVINLVSVE